MEILDVLAAWPGAVWLRASSVLYLFTNAAHILGVALLVGSVLTLDLRLLGLFGGVPLAPLNTVLTRMGLIGGMFAVVTGLALFSVRPADYAGNTAFLAKLALLALASINLLVLTRLPAWKSARDDGAVAAPVRLCAFASLILWPAIVIAGRWIGFV